MFAPALSDIDISQHSYTWPGETCCGSTQAATVWILLICSSAKHPIPCDLYYCCSAQHAMPRDFSYSACHYTQIVQSIGMVRELLYLMLYVCLQLFSVNLCFLLSCVVLLHLHLVLQIYQYSILFIMLQLAVVCTGA